MNGVIGVGPAEAAQLLPPAFLWMMYQWGLDVIRLIQTIQSPAITTLMRFASMLGSELLYAPVIFFTLWCLDEKRGLRFSLILIISAWTNVFLKSLFAQVRPFVLDPSVGIIAASGYTMPSAHAQLAVSFWIPAAFWLSTVCPRRRRTIWTAALSVILLISFSRLYLGVHFPTDIFAGWITGGLVLLLFFAAGKVFAQVRPHIQARMQPQNGEEKTDAQVRLQARLPNIAAACAALAMNGLFPHERALPALFLGFCLGYTLMKQRFPFSAQAEIGGKKPPLQTMLLRCFTGFVSMAALFLALRLIAPGADSLFRSLPAWGADSPFLDMGRFITYGLLAFWAAAGVPRLFQRMGLATDVVD